MSRGARKPRGTRLPGALVAFAAVAALVALAGCGGRGSGSPGGPGKAAGGTPGAGTAAQAAVLLRKALGPNPSAASGHVSGTIDITLTGVPRYTQPIQATMVGRFSDAPGAPLGNWDLLLGLSVRNLDFGAGMTAVGPDVYLNIGSTAFHLPEARIALMRSNAAAGAGNGLMKLSSSFGLQPRPWVRDPRILGHAQVDGVDTIHGTATVYPARFFASAMAFLHLLNVLGVTGLAGIPSAISPAEAAALARSVKRAQADLWAGASDDVPRKAEVTMTLAVAPADRKVLGGIRTAKIHVELDVSEVGAPQQIKVLSDRQPWANVIPLLHAAAFSNRPAGQTGN